MNLLVILIIKQAIIWLFRPLGFEPSGSNIEDSGDDSKSQGGIMIFSVGPTICDTYQVCGVYIECENIHRNKNF